MITLRLITAASLVWFFTQSTADISFGIALAAAASSCLIALEKWLKNTTTLIAALFCGYLFGSVLSLILSKVLTPTPYSELAQTFTFLTGLYLGSAFIIKQAGQLQLIIPFLQFKNRSNNQKFILDISTLEDCRIADFAQTGLLNDKLAIPTTTLEQVKLKNEQEREKIEETISRLKNMSDLNMEVIDTENLKNKCHTSTILQLAKTENMGIIVADSGKLEQVAPKETKIINFNTLSKTLKPVEMTGDKIQIKVQRYGKEARQGVGYLEDGTMVVINGAAEYIGQMISAQVLSIKHTTSGRIIFSNCTEESAINGQSLEKSLDKLKKNKEFSPL